MTPAIDDAIGARLLGAEVTTVAEHRDTLTLRTDRGVLIGKAEGDCCSESWFAAIDDVFGVGGTITAVESVTEVTEAVTEAVEGDVVKVYFGIVRTTTGRVLFELRNTSNGYYDGSVDWTWKPS